MLRVPDPYAAFCLDSAIAEWGRAVESALDRIEGKNAKEINMKRSNELRDWLGLPKQYKNPVGPTR